MMSEYEKKLPIEKEETPLEPNEPFDNAPRKRDLEEGDLLDDFKGKDPRPATRRGGLNAAAQFFLLIGLIALPLSLLTWLVELDDPIASTIYFITYACIASFAIGMMLKIVSFFTNLTN